MADLRERFFDFAEAPTREKYLSLRQEILEREDYDPYSDDLDEVDECLERERFEDAAELLADGMPNLLLSPRAHLMLAMVADAQGKDEVTQAEGLIAAACVDGILATGDGSRARPYVVLRESDAFDVLEDLEKEVAEVRMEHDGPRHLAVITTEDGGEYWFDLTEAYDTLGDVEDDDELGELGDDE